MLTMTKIPHRQMKRYHIEDDFNYPITKNVVKRELIDRNWSIQNRKKFKKSNEDEQEYHSQVYLKFFPSTLKCSLDVIVKSTNKLFDENDEKDSILIAKSRIPKIIKPGVIRVRLVSSLFSADTDVQEDPSLIKLETIRNHSHYNQFDKQFALVLKVKF